MNKEATWLTVADLPSNIHGKKLDKWLEINHPGKRVLVEGHLSPFIQLLPELQLLIISFISVEKCALLCRTNRWFETWLLPVLYTKAKDLPPSLHEIRRELSLSHHVFICMEFEKVTCVASATNMSADYMDCAGAVRFISDPHQPKHVRVEPYPDNPPMRMSSVISAKKMFVDLLSESIILSRRGSLIKHNKDYVQEQMIQRYNKAFEGLTDKQKFVLCHMAHITNKGVNDVLESRYNTRDYIDCWWDFTKRTFSHVLTANAMISVEQDW